MDIKIILGEGSLTEKTINVASYTNHENFTFPNNDITIIELAEEVDLTVYTPACMAKTSDTTTFDGKNAWAYGEITMGKIPRDLYSSYTECWTLVCVPN